MTVQGRAWGNTDHGTPTPVRIPAQRTAGQPLVEPQPAARARRLLNQETALVLLADVLAALAVAVVAGSTLPIFLLVVAAVLWKLNGLYSRRLTLSALDDLPSLLAGLLFGAATLTVLAITFRPELADSLRIALLSTSMGATVVGFRFLAYSSILRRRTSGRINYRTLMIGSGGPARFLVERIKAHPECGLSLVGTLAHHSSRGSAPLPVLGAPEDLAGVLQEQRVTDVVVGFGGMSSADLVELLRTCDRADVEIYMVPRLFEMHHLQVRDEQIWGLPMVRLRRPPQRVATWHLKGAFDKTVAAVALVLALPLLALIALAVRVELGPGVIFRQRRVGLGGREFDLLKFRSMAPTAPTAGTWSVSPADLRPVGRFIRRFSLDELPQLVNVVRGDMSLVGPRPERPEFVEQFRAAMPPYTHRHRVPVGLTGLAAVNGLRGDTSIQDRVHFDNWYIDNWSLWLDMKILIRTVSSVLRGSGA